MPRDWHERPKDTLGGSKGDVVVTARSTDAWRELGPAGITSIKQGPGRGHKWGRPVWTYAGIIAAGRFGLWVRSIAPSGDTPRRIVLRLDQGEGLRAVDASGLKLARHTCQGCPAPGCTLSEGHAGPHSDRHQRPPCRACLFLAAMSSKIDASACPQ
jgi:hypothetical protein